ncbi:hypothetical protein [Kitasatospora sp. NPDC101183]|uniref:hypothetical protein n=1 Tax=Kitasatospora sp. NPDC101183 TaxID=3364100 RepID=UPI0037F42FF5
MSTAIPDNGFTAHHFPGTSDGVVLIIAGLHTSEQCGVEVANWILAKLADPQKQARLGAIVIPEVFPQYGRAVRRVEWIHPGGKWEEKIGKDRHIRSNDYREYPYAPYGGKLFPNRQFPPPGQPLSYLLDKSGKGMLKTFAGGPVGPKGRAYPLLPQLRYLIGLIEMFRPVRIVSIHGMHRKSPTATYGDNYSGVFVDPRYALSKTDIAEVMANEAKKASDPTKVSGLEKYKFDLALDPAYPTVKDANGNPVPKRFDSAILPDGKKDDQLALDLATRATAINSDAHLVWGNHLDDPKKRPAVVHYARETDTPTGYSLGDWGPVDVPGVRLGAPVFTIEPDQDFESWAFIDGVQYVAEDGSPLTVPQRNPPQILPAKFPALAARSRSLQAYAQAVIDVLLA